MAQYQIPIPRPPLRALSGPPVIPSWVVTNAGNAAALASNIPLPPPQQPQSFLPLLAYTAPVTVVWTPGNAGNAASLAYQVSTAVQQPGAGVPLKQIPATRPVPNAGNAAALAQRFDAPTQQPAYTPPVAIIWTPANAGNTAALSQRFDVTVQQPSPGVPLRQIPSTRSVTNAGNAAALARNIPPPSPQQPQSFLPLLAYSPTVTFVWQPVNAGNAASLSYPFTTRVQQPGQSTPLRQIPSTRTFTNAGNLAALAFNIPLPAPQQPQSFLPLLDYTAPDVPVAGIIPTIIEPTYTIFAASVTRMAIAASRTSTALEASETSTNLDP